MSNEYEEEKVICNSTYLPLMLHASTFVSHNLEAKNIIIGILTLGFLEVVEMEYDEGSE